MNKIKKTSIFFRIIFQFLFFVIPLFFIIGWLQAPEGIQTQFGIISPIPKSYSHLLLHTIQPSEKLLGFLVDSIPVLLQLYILYSLIKLFRLYENGEIFSALNVKRLRNIGYGLVFYEIARRLSDGFLGIVLTIHNPPGYRLAQITFDQTNIGVLLVGLFMILISWIMTEGCKLQEEQQLTI